MSARKRLALDAVLCGALLVAYYPAKTGLAVHEWLSVAILFPLLLHVALNWDWAIGVARRFVDRLLSASRVNFIVDALLFVSSAAVILSGLLVSQVVATSLGASTSANVIWHALHSVSADATIVLLLVHLALHWRWVLRTVGVTGRGQSSGAQTVATSMHIHRTREGTAS